MAKLNGLLLELNMAARSLDFLICSDAELTTAVCSQDQKAFSALISRHYQAVYRVAWRACRNDADSEDVTQEAFLKLWNNPSQLRDGNAVKGWLMRVASNLVMDKFRQKPMQELEEAAHVADHSTPADAMLDRAHVASRIDEVIANLPERQRLALTMVHFEHLTNSAAAAAMEISVDALESLLARARRSLKTILADDGKLLLAAITRDGD